MTDTRIDQIVRAQSQRPIDADTCIPAFVGLRADPAALAELASRLILECVSSAWLFPSLCGWLPLDRLDQLAGEASAHLTHEPDCEPAQLLLEHHSLRRAGAHSPPVMHVRFPDDVLAQRIGRFFRRDHPTWAPTTVHQPVAVMGGASQERCPNCAGDVERLLRLPAEPVAHVVRSRPAVEFIWCKNCSPFAAEATFSSVDPSGVAHLLPLEMGMPVEPGGPWPAFEETPVGLVDLGSEWRRQEWGLSNGVENLNRVLGVPSWVQSEWLPACPQCAHELTFVAQLDQGQMSYDEGVTYLLWCDDCAISAVVHQQT